jgi:hypothetical protein
MNQPHPRAFMQCENSFLCQYVWHDASLFFSTFVGLKKSQVLMTRVSLVNKTCKFILYAKQIFHLSSSLFVPLITAIKRFITSATERRWRREKSFMTSTTERGLHRRPQLCPQLHIPRRGQHCSSKSGKGQQAQWQIRRLTIFSSRVWTQPSLLTRGERKERK